MPTPSLAGWVSWIRRVLWNRRMRAVHRDPAHTLAQWQSLQRDYKRTFGFEFRDSSL